MTLTGGGTGSGRVTSTDAAHIIDCGIAAGVATPTIKCDVLIEKSNDNLTLRATPDPGSAFVSWACTRDQVFGDCTPCPTIGDCKMTWTSGAVPLRFRITATFRLNQPPVVAIASPAANAQFAVHAPITFTGSATDPEEGSLPVHWSPPQPPYTAASQLGTGPTLTIDDAQVGLFEIAAWAQDQYGEKASLVRQVSVVFGGEIAFDIGEFELRRSSGPVTPKFADGGKPAWSPDGQRIAFVKFDGKDTEIYVMNADGTGTPLQVTNNSADDDTPAWSPDGQKLAFDSDSIGGQRDIFFKDFTNGQVTRVTNHSKDDVEPAWCGTDILFTSDRDGDDEIYKQGKVLSAAPQQLTSNSVNDVDPHWSVDCTVIVFSHQEPNGNLDIYTMNPDGTGGVNHTDHPANDRQPELSPDKFLIVFKSDRGGSESLWFIRTLPPAAAKPRLWKSTLNAGHPRWKP